MAFTFLMAGENLKKEYYFVTHENFMKFKFVSIKFYWKRDTPICLDVFCGHFHGQSCLVVWSFIENFLQPVFHGVVVHWSSEGLGEAKISGSSWVKFGSYSHFGFCQKNKKSPMSGVLH